jgi:hypothetical protein
LERLHRRDLLDAPKLRDVEVRDADVPDQPLLLQLGQRRPALLDVLVGNRPVDLVDVDRVGAESLEARFRLAQDRVALEAVFHAPPGPFDERALGEHVRTSRQPGERAPDDRLRAAEAVGSRRVDPVHTEIDGAPDGSERLLVVLRAPPELPAATTDRPCAEPDSGDLKARRTELSGPQPCLLHHLASFESPHATLGGLDQVAKKQADTRLPIAGNPQAPDGAMPDAAVRTLAYRRLGGSCRTARRPRLPSVPARASAPHSPSRPA